MKAIKRRRLTVKNISQITKAMNLVATSKLQRARANLAAVGKPVQATFGMVQQTLGGIDRDVLRAQPFIAAREVKNTAYVLITGNRGLCGGYNSNACKALLAHARQHGKKPIIIPLGTKGRDYFKRRAANILEVGAYRETPTFDDAKAVSDALVQMYERGEIDEVYLVYTQFFTVLALEPIVRQVLPMCPDYLRRVVGTDLHAGEKWEDLGFFKQPRETAAHAKPHDEVELEPGLADVLAGLMPWYLGMFVFAAMGSAARGEQAARMTSMDSATKNAGEIIDKLTLMFNRQRQSSITQEITEIVSGANALQ
jgi:F-type H+-transporting ATPase subunit gamma